MEENARLVLLTLISTLEYCVIVWSFAPKPDVNKIKLTQNRVARFALNCSMRKNVEVMNYRLLWLTVT